MGLLTPARLVALLAIAALGSACSSDRVIGAVGDEEIPVRTAMFSEHPEAFGEDGLIFVVLTELPDACASYSWFQSKAEATDDPEELAAAWAQVFPERFWEVVVVLRVADPAYSLEGLTLTGLRWDDLLELRNHWFARFTRHTAHRDAAWFDGEGATEDYLDEFLSHEGSLRMKRHEPGERLKILGQTLVVETESETPQGLVKLRFDAEPCPGVLGL